MSDCKTKYLECANCKQFLVLTQAKDVCARNQLTNAEITIFLKEGEILLNPGDIGNMGALPGNENQCNTEFVREVTRIKKNVEFDEVEVVEGGKVIFNARLIKDIEFKVSHSPILSEFTGNIAFKVVQIPFAGYIEIKSARPGDKVKLCGIIEGELDRPRIGIPFIAVNEAGGEEDVRLLHKLPGAVVIIEKTVVKVCGEVASSKAVCK